MRLVTVTLSVMLSSCMVVPRTVTSYNQDCKVQERRITLEVKAVRQLANCVNGADCAGLLAIYGIVASASAVVSGSIAVVGNVGYWAERQGQCSKPASPEAAASS